MVIRFQTIKFIFFALALCVTQMGADCEGVRTQEITPQSSACTAGQAQVRFLDGMMQNLCGCTESAAQMIKPPSVLTCTINSGTRVFVNFLGAQNFHQIQSTNTPSFPPSAVYNPDDNLLNNTHVIHFTAAGTYEFRDAYDHRLSGSFIVL